MAISDAQAGKVIATVPIGRGVDANRFDPGTGLAFSSNGDGTLTVVHEDSPAQFTVVVLPMTAPADCSVHHEPISYSPARLPSTRQRSTGPCGSPRQAHRGTRSHARRFNG